MLESKHPEQVIEKAVSRMMSNGRLANKQLKNLYVYFGPKHLHQAQKPKIHDFGSQNGKNILGSKVVSNEKLINDIVESLEPVFKDRLEVALDPVSEKIDKTNLTLDKLAKDFSEFKDQATRSAQSGAETAEHTGKEVDLQHQMLLELKNISIRLDSLFKPSKP